MSHVTNGLRITLFSTIPLLLLASPNPAAEPDTTWVDPIKAVHAKFTGKKGTFAQFGDSITVTLAYWANLEWEKPKGLDDAGTKAIATVKAHMSADCWRKWKGPEYGSEGGQTITWAADKVDGWLKKLNPEAALIMFGTNDVGRVKLDTYEAKYREVVTKCLANGTVVILSTIPPKHGQLDKSKEYSAVVRKLAGEFKLPLIDYESEILTRRPDDWDGAVVHKGVKNVYDVDTPISADGVHPSAPKKHAGDYSAEGLKHSGYALRTYLTAMSYATVIDRVLK
ncbi:MAG: SGNH/GDSL hydrolase family protein [Phycisphaerae bacterium]